MVSVSTRQTQLDIARREQTSAVLDAAGFPAEAHALLLCGQRVPENLKGYRVCEDDPHHRTPIYATCKSWFCEKCAARATARLIKRYAPVIHVLLDKGPHYYKFYFITLTTTISLHDPDARYKCEHAWKAASKLFDKSQGKGWHKKGQGYIAAGQFAAKGKLFHLHILFFGPYINYAKLKRLWQKLTGYRQIKVEPVEDPMTGTKKILAYSTRFTQFPPEDIPALLKVFKGHRRIRSRGVFFKIPPEKHEEESSLCPICNCSTEYWPRHRYEWWLDKQLEVPIYPHHLVAPGHIYLIDGNKSPP